VQATNNGTAENKNVCNMASPTKFLSSLVDTIYQLAVESSDTPSSSVTKQKRWILTH